MRFIGLFDSEDEWAKIVISIYLHTANVAGLNKAEQILVKCYLFLHFAISRY